MSYSGINNGDGVTTNVDSDLSTVCTIPIRPGFKRLWMDILNADTQLSDFDIATKAHKDSSDWNTIASVASDFTTKITWPIEGCSADLTTQAAAAWEHLSMDVNALYQVRIQARAMAASDTDVTICWNQN